MLDMLAYVSLHLSIALLPVLWCEFCSYIHLTTCMFSCTSAAIGTAITTQETPAFTAIDLSCRLAGRTEPTPHSDAGVLFNHMFPVWLITILLVCLLTYLAHRTLRKGLRLYRAECNASTDNHELDLVHIHQIPVEGQHADPIHSLLPARSEEPRAATTCTSPSLQSAPGAHRKNSSTAVDPGQTALAQPKGVSLAVLSSAKVSTAQQHYAETVLDKSVHLSSAGSHGSLQSLRIRTEADSDSIAPSLAENALQTKPSAVLLDTRLSTSSGHESVSSFATSSSSMEQSAPLLPKTSLLHEAPAPQPQDVGASGMLLKQTIPGQQCTGQVQRPALPRGKCLAAGGMWVAFAALQLAKSQLRACSPGYWAVYIIQALSLLGASLFFVKKACPNQQQCDAADAVTHTVCLDQSMRVPSVLVRASAVAVGGGALASTIGMGGAVITGPLLLSLQIHPLVTAATSTLMLLFSSSAATLSFAVAGSINTEYALVYGTCNLFSSLAGVFMIGRVVRRTGKSAVVVLLLACIMAAGASASAVFGGRESLRNFQTSSNLTFSSICT